jgi:hypothetical protein
MNIAVFSVDPGGASGLAWGIFNPLVDAWEALKKQVHPGMATITGDARTQIVEIASLWSSFFNVSVKRGLLPPERCYLVVEDYVYVPGVNYEGDSAKISTSIIWGLEGYRMGRRDEWLRSPGRKTKTTTYLPPMVLQRAAEAKAFATKDRFRQNDLWVPGYAGKNEHIFSAMQHIAYFLQRYRTLHPK